MTNTTKPFDTLASDEVDRLREEPDCIESRREYAEGSGYHVELECTYRRRRRVRARDEEEAMAFAAAREAKSSAKYFGGRSKHQAFHVSSITPTAVEEIDG